MTNIRKTPFSPPRFLERKLGKELYAKLRFASAPVRRGVGRHGSSPRLQVFRRFVGADTIRPAGSGNAIWGMGDVPIRPQRAAFRFSVGADTIRPVGFGNAIWGRGDVPIRPQRAAFRFSVGADIIRPLGFGDAI